MELHETNKQWMPTACSVKEFWEELERLLKEAEEITSSYYLTTLIKFCRTYVFCQLKPPNLLNTSSSLGLILKLIKLDGVVPSESLGS
jgi:hypothetical protein